MSPEQSPAKRISQLGDEPLDAGSGEDSVATEPARSQSPRPLSALSALLLDNEEHYRQRAGSRYIAPADISGPPSQPASVYEAKIHHLSQALRRPGRGNGSHSADSAAAHALAPVDSSGAAEGAPARDAAAAAVTTLKPRQAVPQLVAACEQPVPRERLEAGGNRTALASAEAPEPTVSLRSAAAEAEAGSAEAPAAAPAEAAPPSAASAMPAQADPEPDAAPSEPVTAQFDETAAAPAAEVGEGARPAPPAAPSMSMSLQLAFTGWPKRNGLEQKSEPRVPREARAGTPAPAQPSAAAKDVIAAAEPLPEAGTGRAETAPQAAEGTEKQAEGDPAQARAERSAEVKEKRSPDFVEPIVTAKPTPEPKPVAKAGGGGGSGNSGGGGGGGGGGSGGGPVPLQQRYFDPDFRQVLGKGLAYCRRNMLIVALFSFVLNILILAIPIYLFQIADRVLTSRSVDTLIMLTIVVCGALLAHVILDMMRRYMLMRVAVDVETKLGAPVLSAAALASHSGSSREFQALGDLQHLRSFLTGPVLLTMFDSPVAPLFMLVVFLIHPQLGLIVLFAALALLVIAVVNQKLTAVPFAHANAYNVRANLQADAMARNCQVINAMGMIPEAVLMWGRETAESLKAQVRGQDRNIFMTGVSKVIRLFAQVAILGWGAWLAINGELTGGMIIAASIIGSRALAPIEGTIEGWRNFVQARSAYERIRMLLMNSPLNLERLRLPRPQGRLAVERVLFVPPPTKKVILNGVNFELEPGQSLAIIGPSGSGKSTLARMIVGAIAPTAGNVRLDMMDLRNWDPRQFGESVGYLPQDVQLFPASIKANIARMRDDVTDEMIFDAAELADVHEMISEFAQGYETQVAMDGSPLSGGQKQRIGLARAFFGYPRLVVLDEPNSNLDVPGERALARAMQRAKERGITAVVITQRPELLKSVDLVLMLKEGTVQAFGECDEMLRLLGGAKSQPSGPESNGHGSPGNAHGGHSGNGSGPNGSDTPPEQS